MQAKDIPDEPILALLANLPPWPDGMARRWGTMWPGGEASVHDVMPAGTPEKVALAKMRSMIRRGLVLGCACGCRGDFELPGKWPE